jgi:hypothetical protein
MVIICTFTTPYPLCSTNRVALGISTEQQEVELPEDKGSSHLKGVKRPGKLQQENFYKRKQKERRVLPRLSYMK